MIHTHEYADMVHTHEYADMVGPLPHGRGPTFITGPSGFCRHRFGR